MMVQTLWGEEEVDSKICIYCKKEKPLEKFNFRYYDGKPASFRENRCRKCTIAMASLRRRLRKEAPPKLRYCQCCGREKDINGNIIELHLDHDRETEKFRGWLCKDCNTALGLLGDNLEGVAKAAKYLKDRVQNFDNF